MLEPCDVIFVKRKRNSSILDKITQWLVKWATGSQYFHVAYFVSSNVIFEANSFRNSGFAVLEDISEYEVKRLDLPLEVRINILSRILYTEGSVYGWGEVISLLLRKKFGIGIYYDNPKEFICSEELVAAVYAETGIRIIDQTTGDVSPEDLWSSRYLVGIR